ncbi:hypothetical protein MTR_6g022030 [Medicago truncatula]|uniref:Uncharacterized protein n=1 Tax=Medicago truncatula TaxID=3880 RepID=G7KN79_MEDTR|nr:hypothetical protein MTR_6g022030 [Medicago truncatula]
MFINEDNLHLTSWFCAVVLGPTMISKKISELLQDLLDHLLSGFRYQITHHLCLRTKLIYVYEPSPIVLVVMGCVKSLTSDRR